MEPCLARDKGQATADHEGATAFTEPYGEPDISHDIRVIAETMRAGVLKLDAAKELASILEGISFSLEVQPTPTSIMEAALSGLTELESMVALAVGAPHDLPEPYKLDVIGEATMRARFGMKHLTNLYSDVVAEQLEQCLENIGQLRGAAQQVCSSLQELHEALTTSAGISNAVKNLEVLQQRVEALAVRARGSDGRLAAATAPWKKALGLTAFAFEDLLRKLSGTQANVVPLSEEVTRRIRLIEEIVSCASDDIRAAFQVPQPACFCQAMTIGQDPSTMRSMLTQLGALRKLEFDKVTEVLTSVAEAMRALSLEHASNAVKNFAACAGGQLNTLDAVLLRHRLAERLVRRDERENNDIGDQAEAVTATDSAPEENGLGAGLVAQSIAAARPRSPDTIVAT